MSKPFIRGEDGPLLIYVTEAEDHERGGAEFQSSQLAIDLEHRWVMNEVLAEKLQLKPLYDCALTEPRTS